MRHSAGTWSGKTSEVPYPLSFCRHSFKYVPNEYLPMLWQSQRKRP